MDLKVGIVQFSPIYGEMDQNITELTNLVKSAARKSPDYLVLPEMCHSGYIFPDEAVARRFALTPGGDDPVFRRFLELARASRTNLVFGFLENGGQALFNSQAWVDPQGKIRAIYRKRHLFDPDWLWSRPGDRPFVSQEATGLQVGLGVCMDLNYNDFVDFHIQEGTELVCFSSNWVEQGIDVLGYWYQRWGAFPGVVAAANRGGSEYGIPFSGNSAVFRKGELLGMIQGTGNGELVVGISNCL